MSEYDPQIRVLEYKNGVFNRSWNGVSECARYHHIGFNLLKTLLATGSPLPEDPAISFDLDLECPYHFELYTDSNGRKKPRLVLEVQKAIGEENEV